MFTPKKTKFRKSFRNRGNEKFKRTKGALLAFGSYGLKAIENGEISSKEVEAARRAITKYVKRGGKIWIRIFPHKPITQKAAEVPMGSGKGSVEKYVAEVYPGLMLFEMDGVTQDIAKEAMVRASHKLSVKCRFIDKNVIM
jgi:large subunit ribosomal protein L16